MTWLTEPLARDRQSGRADRKFAEHVSTSQPLAIDINCPRPNIDPVARIFRPSRSVMTSARVSGRPLVFERQAPPVIDCLMGYTGASDTLTQVELHFPTRDAAIAYAKRQKLNCTVVDDRSRRP
ncbi:NADH dehydrogenase ubiquinone Fe-S protein 4 [Sinorhizobium sp. GL28]|uniref:NADH dehydrogenase ubiquinone Fe-S protein 4 n=1 Tax=Sinorhizobium sp. GL28 TaxID=1358418 RepID=UPI0009E77951|nr:NADH dehydrogenase ubiquinone Fe-S protein 4 [Sinorhizobium sp. GL28]